MIAMALACQPQLIIADEPTTALDVTVQAQILALLKEVTRAANSALILITHDLGVVARYADRVCVMYGGRIIETGPAREIYARPRHPYTIGLLAARPDLDAAPATAGGTRSRPPLRTIPGMVPPPQQFPSGCRFHPRCGYARPTADSAGPACAAAVPPLREIEPGHFVRCHYAGDLGVPRAVEVAT